MRVYTASRFGAYERTRAFNDALRAAGHEITHDWTRTEGFDEWGHPTGPVNEADLSTDVAVDHAMRDLDGVRAADLTILFHEEGCTGALIEAGATLALGHKLWVIDPCRLSIFWRLPSVTVFPDADAVLEALDATARAA